MAKKQVKKQGKQYPKLTSKQIKAGKFDGALVK